MSKKLFLCLVAFAAAAGMVFAQEQEQEQKEEKERPLNTVALQVTVVGAAVNYERSFTPNLSVLGDISVNFFPATLTAAVKARVYPFGGMFFAEAGLGYGMTFGYIGLFSELLGAGTMFGHVGTKENTDLMLQGVVVTPAMGWKIGLGNFDLQAIIGMDFFFGPREKIPFDVMPNLRLGAGFSF